MKAAFVYDDENWVIEKTHFGAGSIAANKTFNNYDEEGNRTRSERYDGEGNLVSTGR